VKQEDLVAVAPIIHAELLWEH